MILEDIKSDACLIGLVAITSWGHFRCRYVLGDRAYDKLSRRWLAGRAVTQMVSWSIADCGDRRSRWSIFRSHLSLSYFTLRGFCSRLLAIIDRLQGSLDTNRLERCICSFYDNKDVLDAIDILLIRRGFLDFQWLFCIFTLSSFFFEELKRDTKRKIFVNIVDLSK